jgi:hypothetical protein
MRLLRNRDVIGGLVLIATGLAFYLAGRGLDMGTPRRMGPGFLPTASAMIVAGLGVVIVLGGLRRHVDAEAPALRPTLLILCGVAAFALIVPRLGLMPAVAGAVFVSAFADPRHTALTAGLLAAGAAVGAWVIFVLGLSLQVPAFSAAF